MTQRLATTIKTALRRTGALDVIARATASDRLDIMLYHGFSEGSRRDPRHPKLMPVGIFEEHVRIYARYAKPVSLEDFASRPAPGIAITFDDGYAGNYRLALPVLQKYGFPATVFVTTGFADRTVFLWCDWLEYLVGAVPEFDADLQWRGERLPLFWNSAEGARAALLDLKLRLRLASIAEIHGFLRRLETLLNVRYSWETIPEVLRPLAWDEIRAMRRGGLVSIGAHTVSHPVLSRCTADVQRFEISTSRRRIEEELGEKCTLFAYPFGTPADYDETTIRITAESGFDLAVSTGSGFNRRTAYDRYRLNRWGADLASDQLSYLAAGGPVAARFFHGTA